MKFKLPTIAAGLSLAGAVLFPPAAEAQCVDEALKQQLVAQRAHRGVVPRLIKKAYRHEISPMGGWYAADASDGGPIYGGAYTFYFAEDFGLEAGYWRSSQSYTVLEALAQDRPDRVDIVDGDTGVNLFMGHILWSLAYGKVRWLGGPIGRYDFYLALGGGAVGEPSEEGLSGSFGFGSKFYFNEWLAFRLDVRDHIHRQNRPTLGLERMVNDITAQGGLSLFIPFHN